MPWWTVVLEVCDRRGDRLLTCETWGVIFTANTCVSRSLRLSFSAKLVLFAVSLQLVARAHVKAYTIFIAENLIAWVAAVTNCGTILPISVAIAMQLVLFLPLAMVRNLAHLSGAVILADVLIVLGSKWGVSASMGTHG